MDQIAENLAKYQFARSLFPSKTSPTLQKQLVCLRACVSSAVSLPPYSSFTAVRLVRHSGQGKAGNSHLFSEASSPSFSLEMLCGLLVWRSGHPSLTKQERGRLNGAWADSLFSRLSAHSRRKPQRSHISVLFRITLHCDGLRLWDCDTLKVGVSVGEAGQDLSCLFELCHRPNSQLLPSSLVKPRGLSQDCAVGGERTTRYPPLGRGCPELGLL